MIKTVVVSEKFIPNNWWWRCSLSASNGGFPFNNLLIIANNVSRIGIPNIVTGTKNANSDKIVWLKS